MLNMLMKIKKIISFFLPGKIDPWEGDGDSVTVDCQLINPLNQEIPKHALGNIKQ